MGPVGGAYGLGTIVGHGLGVVYIWGPQLLHCCVAGEKQPPQPGHFHPVLLGMATRPLREARYGVGVAIGATRGGVGRARG